ncbi:MAG: PQQ-binding-like beta-propeller repeat protein [Pseudomonadota bacterium]
MKVIQTLLLVLAYSALLSACYDTDAWPTIHGDARNSDTTIARGFTSLQPIWVRDFPGAIAAAATIDGEHQIYVTTTGSAETNACHLYAIDQSSGEDLWCTAEVNRWAVGSSVLIDIEGNLFIGDDEAMHSFDRDGHLRWETPTVGAAISAQFASDSHLIFITHIGQVMVLTRGTGELVTPVYELLPEATYEPGAGLGDCLLGGPDCPSANTLAMDLSTGRFYATLRPPATSVTELRALQYDPKSRLITPVWTNDSLGGGTASSPVISADGGRVYVNDNDGNYLALDAITGAEIWNANIGYSPAGSPSVSTEGRGIPAGAGTSRLMAIQDLGSEGTISWSRDTVTHLGVAVQAAGDVLYATVRQPGTFLGVDVLSVNARTGGEHDRQTLSPSPIATVGTSVAADGTVVVAGINGVVTALREAADGAGAVERIFQTDRFADTSIEGVTVDAAACILSVPDADRDAHGTPQLSSLWDCITQNP